MKNPWIDDKAFDAMFSDVVEITRKKTNERGTVYCSFFPLEDVTPFIENDTDTLIKSANVLIKISDWRSAFGNTEPEIGDGLKGLNDVVYKIADVTKEQSWFKLIGRTYK